MSERLVVDGKNVIGSRPTGWWHDLPGAMRDLVEQLHHHAARIGTPVTVVFDGRAHDDVIGGGTLRDRLEGTT